MPTPKQGYYTEAGKRVPSVTTVISRFKDSGALIHWANQLAYVPYRNARALIERIVKQGQLDPGTIGDCMGFLKPPPEFCDYRTARDTAAGIGTIVHALIDGHIRKRPVDLSVFVTSDIPDPAQAAKPGLSAFMEWAGQTQFQLEEGEVPLVSEKFDFGGTPDVTLIKGERTVGDWKTGDIYPEQVLPQLAAYRQLLLENGHKVGNAGNVMSINKKTGGFVHRYFTGEEMDKGWAVFWRMRELYDLVKELK